MKNTSLDCQERICQQIGYNENIDINNDKKGKS